MNNKKLKEEFINSFGEEKWNQEEMLAKLVEPQMELCKYLGIEMVPVICEDIPDDSRYYFKDEYIVLSPRMLLSYTDALKSLVHEMRHQYQFKCASDPNSKENPYLVNLWRDDLTKNAKYVNPFDQDSVTDYYSLVIELDAHAFSKWYLLYKYDIPTTHPDIIYDELLTRYIKKYLRTEKS